MAHVHVFWVRFIGLKLSCDLWAMVYSAWPIVCGLYRYGLWAIGRMGIGYGPWAMDDRKGGTGSMRGTSSSSMVTVGSSAGGILLIEMAVGSSADTRRTTNVVHGHILLLLIS